MLDSSPPMSVSRQIPGFGRLPSKWTRQHHHQVWGRHPTAMWGQQGTLVSFLANEDTHTHTQTCWAPHEDFSPNCPMCRYMLSYKENGNMWHMSLTVSQVYSNLVMTTKVYLCDYSLCFSNHSHLFPLFMLQAGEKSESATRGLHRSCQPAADYRRQQPRTLLQTRG